MGHAFILTALLKFFVVAGFAYVIWLLALKESAALKIIGQIIAVAILILVVIATVVPGRMPRHNNGHLKGGLMMTGMRHEGSGEVTGMPGSKGWHKHDRHRGKDTDTNVK